MCRLQPCAAAGCNPISPKQAEQLFEWGLRRNANCSLCHSNLGDVRLKLDEPNPNPDPNPDPKPKPNPKPNPSPNPNPKPNRGQAEHVLRLRAALPACFSAPPATRLG